MKKPPIIALVILVILVTADLLHTQPADASTGWTQSTHRLQTAMVSVGYDAPLASAIINECKATAKDPRKCVVLSASIGCAESSCGQNAYRFNVFGVNKPSEVAKYKSRTDAVKAHVKRYNIWWYTQDHPNDFYSPSANVKPTTHYCMSEYSSKSPTHCPNWYRHSLKAFNILSQIK